MTALQTGTFGILPELHNDRTDFSTLRPATRLLFARLHAAASLQQTFNPSATLASQQLGRAFNRTSGLAIAPDGTIAVMNSYFGVMGDRLAFVDPVTGLIDTNQPILNIRFNNAPSRNVQGLAYADLSLNGNVQLYAIDGTLARARDWAPLSQTARTAFSLLCQIISASRCGGFKPG